MVIYEWDIETVTDEDTEEHEKNEVLDHNFCESYKALREQLTRFPDAGDGLRFDVVLVRDGYYGRSWAYVEDGKLPEFFHDADGRNAALVPKRFHAEVRRG